MLQSLLSKPERAAPAMRIQEEKGSWAEAGAELAWGREELSCLSLCLWVRLPSGFVLLLMLCVISVPTSNHGSGLVLPTLESNWEGLNLLLLTN